MEKRELKTDEEDAQKMSLNQNLDTNTAGKSGPATNKLPKDLEQQVKIEVLEFKVDLLERERARTDEREQALQEREDDWKKRESHWEQKEERLIKKISELQGRLDKSRLLEQHLARTAGKLTIRSTIGEKS